MPLFDSHCHLYERSFDKDRQEVIHNATGAGVRAMMIVGADEPSSEAAVALANQYDGLYASVGVHPHYAEGCTTETLTRLTALAGNDRVKAWGEIGLDFFRMRSGAEIQEQWFLAQLELAAKLELPVIFHERQSDGRLLALLQGFGPLPRKGVVHCFSGTESELAGYLALGLYIGVTGIVTMTERGARLREMLSRLPLQRILIETDAPYLTPAPFSKKTRRNQPAFVAAVLQELSRLYQQPPDDLSRIVWDNTCRLYGVAQARTGSPDSQ